MAEVEKETPDAMLSSHRWTASSRRAAGYASVALLFLLACAAALRAGGRAAAVPEETNAEVLQFNQRAIERVQGELQRDPTNPRLAERLAQTHLARVHLMAVLAYERQRPRMGDQTRLGEDYVAWRRVYLRTDPEQVVTDTLRVVRDALRRHPPDRERGELLSVQATALCCLGRHREEAATLRQATRLRRDPAALAGRLARAHAEAGQFRQAEAAFRTYDSAEPPRFRFPLAPPDRETGLLSTTERMKPPRSAGLPNPLRSGR